MDNFLENIDIYNVQHLPIVRAFIQRIGIPDELERNIPSEMEVPVGSWCMLMILDTLSGRSPLYRLEEFAEQQDLGLLLGKDYEPSTFNDDAAGRFLDKLYRANPMKLFTNCALRACREFQLNSQYLRFDTTSRSLYGDYIFEEADALPFLPTYGYSKDHRPDLKQFVIATLCVDKNIPLVGYCRDGNASDKKLNNELLSNISKIITENSESLRRTIYVADSALITQENLELLKETFFISRLPATFKKHGELLAEAARSKDWEDVGILAEAPGSKRKPAARYRVCEREVELYGEKYRAIIVHSSGHDKRREKKLKKELNNSRQEAEKFAQKEAKKEYACQEDAKRAAEELKRKRWPCHRLEVKVEERAKYTPGRPPKRKVRRVKELRYGLQIIVKEDEKQVEYKRLISGCFVIVSNAPKEGELRHSAKELLRAYKEQYGVEQNFRFLKDPLIVNSIFIKKPERIEALGLILLLSLLVWRLMEKTMRSWTAKDGNILVGLDKKKTKRPTSFMMRTKFVRVIVIRQGNERKLAYPLNDVQLSYLQALGLKPSVFTSFALIDSINTS